LFCRIFELDHGIFLDIVARYSPKYFRELFEIFLIIKAIGCFTTHSDDLISQIKKKSYWKRFKLEFGSMRYLARFWQGVEGFGLLGKDSKVSKTIQILNKARKNLKRKRCQN
jgi:hypothetical protein